MLRLSLEAHFCDVLASATAALLSDISVMFVLADCCALRMSPNIISLKSICAQAFTPHKYLLTAAIGAGKATIDM